MTLELVTMSMLEVDVCRDIVFIARLSEELDKVPRGSAGRIFSSVVEVERERTASTDNQ